MLSLEKDPRKTTEIERNIWNVARSIFAIQHNAICRFPWLFLYWAQGVILSHKVTLLKKFSSHKNFPPIYLSPLPLSRFYSFGTAQASSHESLR